MPTSPLNRPKRAVFIEHPTVVLKREVANSSNRTLCGV